MANYKCICKQCDGDVLSVHEEAPGIVLAFTQGDECKEYVEINYEQALALAKQLTKIVWGY